MLELIILGVAGVVGAAAGSALAEPKKSPEVRAKEERERKRWWEEQREHEIAMNEWFKIHGCDD